jgi:proteasome activator subunit 4
MFIVSAVQLVKIGDLSMEQAGVPLSSSDTPAEDMMDADEDDAIQLPDGTETASQVLSRDEERVLARESTAAFAGTCFAFY